MLYPNLDVSEMFVDRQSQRSSMHTRHLNEQLVRVLKTIGYDVGFQKGQGQYLYDRDDVRYLDLLSGFGVFAIGRNHPALREALKSVLDSDLPNLVQLDVSTLAGVLAERLLEYVPYLDKSFLRIRAPNVSKLRSNLRAARRIGRASSTAAMPIMG
jgi:ornithine--oxo-acid transaminase